MEVADESRVEFPEARIGKVPLPGLLGFRDAIADDFDEIATCFGANRKVKALGRQAGRAEVMCDLTRASQCFWADTF